MASSPVEDPTGQAATPEEFRMSDGGSPLRESVGEDAAVIRSDGSGGADLRPAGTEATGNAATRTDSSQLPSSQRRPGTNAFAVFCQALSFNQAVQIWLDTLEEPPQWNEFQRALVGIAHGFPDEVPERLSSTFFSTEYAKHLTAKWGPQWRVIRASVAERYQPVASRQDVHATPRQRPTTRRPQTPWEACQ